MRGASELPYTESTEAISQGKNPEMPQWVAISAKKEAKMNAIPAPPIVQAAEERWAEVAGSRMRYLHAGLGPPLLLVHGLMGYSFSWRFNIPALAPVRTIYAPDLLGAGFSDRTSGLDCSCRAVACRMLEFMDRCDIQSTDLLGTSHGGAVAVMMAAMAPQRIRKLVLVAPVNPWSRHGLWITKVLGTNLGRLGFQKLTPAIEAAARLWVQRLYGDPRRIAPGTVEGYRAPVLLPGSWTYGLDIIKSWHADLRLLAEDYQRISQPTLLMWGDRDVAVYNSSSQEVLKRIPGARLILYPGVGHMPYEEIPDRFNSDLKAFLN